MNDVKPCAVITGASSGIGREFAVFLAQRGYSLILVARRLERLQSLKQQILQSGAVTVEIVCLDLAAPDAASKLLAEVQKRGLTVEVLINNAGFGLKRDLLETDAHRLQEMIFLNVHTLTQLTLQFGKLFRENGRGFILQLSSIGGFMPTPGMAAYSASKAYVQSFGEALALEWRGSGVSVTTLSPGMTITEFFEVAGQTVPKRLQNLGMSASSVAKIGLKALFQRKPYVTAGVSNKLNVFLMRLMPRWLSLRITAFVVKTMM